MAPVILIRPQAEEDLIRIWIYIARNNPSAADKVFLAAEKTFETIASMPGMGTPYRSRKPELSDIRFHPVQQYSNYLVYYRETPSGIDIILVLHGHMDRPKPIEPDK